MYGEDGEIEYGGSNDSKYSGTFSPEFVRNVYLEGQVSNTFKGLSKSDMFFWDFENISSNIEMAHWSYYENWDPYRNYIVAKEHCGLLEKRLKIQAHIRTLHKMIMISMICTHI